MTKKQISKRIWNLLIDNEMTVNQLALQIHRSRTWTSLHVNGHLESPDTCAAIAEVFGLTVADIWSEKESKRAA